VVFVVIELVLQACNEYYSISKVYFLVTWKLPLHFDEDVVSALNPAVAIIVKVGS